MGSRLDIFKMPFMARDAATAHAAAKPSRAAATAHAGIGRRVKLLAVLLAALLAVDAAIVVYDARQATFGTLYVAAVGKIRMLSQRLAKAAQQASQGNREAFKQLRESRDEFSALVNLLASGGVSAGVELPATPGQVRPQLTALEREWQKSERNATMVVREEPNLVALGAAVRAINENNPALLETADEVSALSVQSGASVRQNAIAAQLVMLTQRMAKNANAMLAGDVVDPEVAFLLGKDSEYVPRPAAGAAAGQRGAAHHARLGPELRGKLAELEAGFKEYQVAVSRILGNMQRLVNAKRATRDMFNDSETLLGAAEQPGRRLRALVGAAAQLRRHGAVSLLALLCCFLIGKAWIDDSRRRARAKRTENKRNQEAILRLLDEMGDLARRRPHGARQGDRGHDRRHRGLDELHDRRAATPGRGHHQRGDAGDAGDRAGADDLGRAAASAAQRQATEIQGTGQSVPQMARR